jgi:uncharacterized membrane protein HdeD (DUF308 family)
MLTGYQVARHSWWILLLRGLAAILFGIAALLWPHLTLLVLVLLFGAYALIDGLVAVGIALHERGVLGRWWVLLIEGLLGVLVGVMTFVWPAITVLVLFSLIVAWAIVTGLLEVVEAFVWQRPFGLEWTQVLLGLLSLVLGIFLLLHPAAGLLALVWLIALYAIVAGLVLLVRAFQFRSLLSSF